jgi:hypothetical protein
LLKTRWSIVRIEKKRKLHIALKDSYSFLQNYSDNITKMLGDDYVIIKNKKLYRFHNNRF